MLEYLNGVGIGRAKKRNPRRATGRKANRGRKRVLAQLPASAVATAMIKRSRGKMSPLQKARLMKFAVEQKRRAKFETEGEPLETYDYENNIDTGVEEVNENEFVDESNHGELGLIYPVEIGGRRDRRIKRKEARQQRKKDKTERKNLRVRSKAEARQTRATAKKLKGERGGFNFKDTLTTVTDTAKDIFGKGREIRDSFEDMRGGGGSGGGGGATDETARMAPTETETPQTQSFFEKNKMLILIGGAVLVGGGIYLATRKK